MLAHLCIRNFTTVATCDLELAPGLSVITGETGAGKSVMLDALGMALGDRSNTNILRDEKRNAEISASFQIKEQSQLHQWLIEHDLLTTTMSLKLFYAVSSRHRVAAVPILTA